ncbi:MAG TPA: hypothetical protein VIY86_12440, partial [Pirellulaceae bacterium]
MRTFAGREDPGVGYRPIVKNDKLTHGPMDHEAWRSQHGSGRRGGTEEEVVHRGNIANMNIRSGIAVVGLVSWCWAASVGLAQYTERLCIGEFQTESQAAAQLDRFRKSFPTMVHWQARATATKRQILRASGLDPLPTRTDLHPLVCDRRSHAGYIVESIAWEAFPGFLVYGTLYRPDPPVQVRSPAILCPHGHHREPNGGGRFHPFT